jgi:hypothetical protein
MTFGDSDSHRAEHREPDGERGNALPVKPEFFERHE